MVRFITILLLLFWSGLAPMCGQEVCGTVDGTDVTPYKGHNPAYRYTSRGITLVPIQFHVFSTSSGLLAVDSSVLFEELILVNEAFAPFGITFVHEEDINYIRENQYVIFTKGLEEDVCDEHDVEGSINVYYANRLQRQDGSALCGYAYDFHFKNRLLMSNTCAANGSTLTHELGHSFSLAHTHSTSSGAELVDGSNCLDAGDHICDTPADPTLSDSNVTDDCEYIGDQKDANGSLYNPDPENYMSYSRKECRVYFTPGQYSIMAQYFDEYDYLLNTLLVADNDVELEASVSVYPNPASDLLLVESGDRILHIQLRDMTGRLLLEQEATGTKTSIDISSLNVAGYHLVTVSTMSGSSVHRLVVYQ